MLKEWKTLELIEFLNSHSRLSKMGKEEAKQYLELRKLAIKEISSRSRLLAIPYLIEDIK